MRHTGGTPGRCLYSGRYICETPVACGLTMNQGYDNENNNLKIPTLDRRPIITYKYKRKSGNVSRDMIRDLRITNRMSFQVGLKVVHRKRKLIYRKRDL